MLITFEGKGCDLCPFYHMFWAKGDQWNECTLHNYTDVVGEPYPELHSVDGNKPDGCPFKGFPGNLEIQAMEAD